jgi:hypothetical protein
MHVLPDENVVKSGLAQKMLTGLAHEKWCFGRTKKIMVKIIKYIAQLCRQHRPMLSAKLSIFPARMPALPTAFLCRQHLP